MAESLKEQSSASANGKSAGSRLLRYPLRSGSKQNEEKLPVADSASAVRRGRSGSNLSKSVSAFDLSAKEKSAKPPRRLSNPLKTAASPAPRPSGSITPVSETRSKGSSGVRGKLGTPISGVPKSSSKKFSVLSSASYWLTQIKLSETAAKHSLSLGFFKLAFEAGCEPLQRIKDELKSYARKHNLTEFEESVKELFQNYNITENFEQLQVSVNCSRMSNEGTRSSDEDVRSSSSVGDATEKKGKVQKDDSVPKVKKQAAKKNPSSLKSKADTQVRNSQKMPQKTKQELKNNNIVKKSAKKSAPEDSINPTTVEEILEENKENLVQDTPMVDEIGSSEV